jgi:hypothetical protein
MNSLGWSLLGGLVALLLLSPRGWAPVWMLAGVLFMPQEQSMDIAGINVTGIRFLEMAAMLRLVVRREHCTFNQIDATLVLAYGYTTLVFLLRSDKGHAYMIGAALDAALCYLPFRAWIRDIDDFCGVLRKFGFLLLPYVGLLLAESLTQHNPFEVLGAASWLDLREGRQRVMGSFRNPSLLGTLGAAFFPLYVAMVMAKRMVTPAVLGGLLCLSVVLLANSGSPVSALGAGALAWFCWPVREHMRLIRRCLVVTLFYLIVLMDAPVWYVLERFSFLTGGSGWHRAHLLNMAFQDLDHWWLAGMDLDNTVRWFPYTLAITGAADITNNYVAFGLNAGLPAMLLLVLLLAVAFRALGRAAKSAQIAGRQGDAFMLWGLGCTLMVHTITWLGITYFDQTYVIWYFHLAAIASLAGASTVKHDEQAGESAMAIGSPMGQTR